MSAGAQARSDNHGCIFAPLALAHCLFWLLSDEVMMILFFQYLNTYIVALKLKYNQRKTTEYHQYEVTKST